MEETKFEKNDKLEVKEFTFPSLFTSGEHKDGVHEYNINELNSHIKKEKKERLQIIKKEKEYAKNTMFKISPVVKKYRGIKEVEESEYQKEVEEEVQRRVNALREKTINEAFEKGKESGHQEVLQLTQEQTQKKLDLLQEMIDDVIDTKQKIIRNQENEIYELLKGLSKWIVLRELKEDGQYIHRLLEKIVLELGTKENLLIKVNEQAFDDMPEVLEVVQSRIGKFSNSRIEVLRESNYKGLVVESSNGICDGSLESQFSSFDTIFESVMFKENESDDE